MEKGGICKKGSISQLTKDNAMICAHEYLGDTGRTSKTSGKRIDYIQVTSGIIPAIIKGETILLKRASRLTIGHSI